MEPVPARGHRRLGGPFQAWYVGREDEGGSDHEEHRGQPVGRVQVDARDDRRQRSADHERQDHRQQRHRVGGDERRARQDGRNHSRLCRPEQLADGGENESDHQQVDEVAAQLWDKGGQRYQRNGGGAAEVAPKHDPLAIHAVRDHSGDWCEQHGGHRVREQRDRDRRAAARDLVREDDQREKKELVSQLRRELREPDVPERGVAQDDSKATRTLDVELERIGLERIGHRGCGC